MGLWSGWEKKKRKNWITRKRVKNREGSLGYPRFMKPVFTKESKPLGKRKRSLGHLGSLKTRTHLKKLPLERLVEGRRGERPLDLPISVVSQNWGGTQPNHTDTSLVPKAKDNDMRKISPSARRISWALI
ncbi:hypothetical protein TNCV_1731631 [Trichonephila clavipes]|nr:hypothetical protein TNCV_1731631 [Trichonephila clavipes]